MIYGAIYLAGVSLTLLLCVILMPTRDPAHYGWVAAFWPLAIVAIFLALLFEGVDAVRHWLRG